MKGRERDRRKEERERGGGGGKREIFFGHNYLLLNMGLVSFPKAFGDQTYCPKLGISISVKKTRIFLSRKKISLNNCEKEKYNK